MKKQLLLLTLAFTAILYGQPGNPVLHTIQVNNNNFSPASLTITVGDTVTWINSSGFHNVNGTTATYPSNPASFGNGSASMNWTYKHGFTTVGTYTYRCDPHVGLGMIGTIIVNPAPAVPCSELFFSEYIEGGGNNKALEIYNPTNATVDLSDYTVYRANNGSTTPGGTLALSGMLASGDVYVMGNPSSSNVSPIIIAESDTLSSITFFNGDDALWLTNNVTGDTLDIFGVIGVDPGSSWTVGTGATNNHTLVRKSTVTGGTKDWALSATQWDVYPQDTTMFLGSHSSGCVASPAMPCSDLFISEYIEGTSNNRGIEIYNPTGATINLSTYTVYMLTGSGAQNSFPLYGSLASDDVFKITTDQADTAIFNQADTALGWPSIVHFTGDDALVLVNGMDTIDVFGTPGVDPGSSWTVGTGSSQNHTLVRKATINKGSTDWTTGANEWDVYPQNTYTFFGTHTSTCISGPIPPTVSFTSAGQTHLEDAGTQMVYMTINPVSTNSEMVKVYVMDGNNITSGDYTLNPAAVMDTLTFNPAAGDDTLMFDVTILDDIIQEGSESITFTIASTSAGLTVGSIATHVFTIDDNDTPIPTYTIDQIDGVDPVNFLLDSSGVECKIIATVLGVDLQGVASGNTQFTIHDGNGLGVFSSSPTGYIVTEGDQIRIIGTLSQFNGLAQISGDSIVVISQGNPIPTPTVVTALSEATESELNRINGVTILDPTQWTNSGSGFNVDISNGTDTFSMRIDNEVDLYSMPAPIGMFDVVGIGGQFDGSDPRNSGYQILPRYMADIIYPTPPSYSLSITEIMPGSADSNPATSPDWFELKNHGPNAINLNGFSFDDDSETPGTATFGNNTIAAGEAIVVWRGTSANKAAFIGAWRATSGNPTVIASDELTGSFPSLGQGGDMVVLYDTSATPIEICKASYNSASAGISLEYDTATCAFAQNAMDGQRGAYTSNKGDIGSPADVSPDISVAEHNLNLADIYPNPAQDVIFIELTGDLESTGIELFNTTGQKIMTSEFESNKYQLNVSNLPKGMYIVKLNRSGNTTAKRLIIK